MEMQINWLVSIWYKFLQTGIFEQTIEKNVPEFVVKCWKNTQKVIFDKMNPFTVFFTNFDHKLQDPFLNKS